MSTSEVTRIDGDTPTLRLFGLLEVIAQKDQFVSLQGLVEDTGLPKPTLHRMLQQLESAGMLQRDGDGRQYSTGLRLRQLAEDLGDLTEVADHLPQAAFDLNAFELDDGVARQQFDQFARGVRDEVQGEGFAHSHPLSPATAPWGTVSGGDRRRGGALCR